MTARERLAALLDAAWATYDSDAENGPQPPPTMADYVASALLASGEVLVVSALTEKDAIEALAPHVEESTTWEGGGFLRFDDATVALHRFTDDLLLAARRQGGADA